MVSAKFLSGKPAERAQTRTYYPNTSNAPVVRIDASIPYQEMIPLSYLRLCSRKQSGIDYIYALFH